MAGVLYVVATPIGNLEDITLRALRVLKEVNLIAAEDTRHTQKLLGHYDIRTPLTSYHEHNERTKARPLVERLLQGQNIALVTDAGVPAISDPGYRIIVEAIKAGIQVTPIPGASALTAVLSACGLPTDRFVFEGFLPAKKKQRRDRLEALRGEMRTIVYFEAPHRLLESLRDIHELLGDREVVVAREVSKVYEEFLRGLAGELIDKLSGREIRGELTIVIKGSAGESPVSEALLKADIRKLKSGGMRVKEIAEILAEKHSLAKREVYRMVLRDDEQKERG
jgi:16S rRNA (cytidine1402-2'-O)-methyltransferase